MDCNDIPIVELLEKERKEWQSERLKLIHCIHLQQIELSQRSAAAYDRATDIARVRSIICMYSYIELTSLFYFLVCVLRWICFHVFRCWCV